METEPRSAVALEPEAAQAIAQAIAGLLDTARAEAWEEGYAASDHEAYHFSTHGRTDNPYRAS